jgi:protein gp37
MSDLFHEDIPFDYLQRAFSTMQRAHWHTFQILTKRSHRLAAVAHLLPWPTNIWMGISVETPKYFSRIKDLLLAPAAVRFLSLEPLLAPLPDLPLRGIDWVIVGGESGPGARPMKSEWVKDIRRNCRKEEVPFFFKQWGGVRKKATGRRLDGKLYDEMPQAILRQAPRDTVLQGSEIPIAV